MQSSRAGRYDDVARAAERIIESAITAGEDRLAARGASGYATQAVWSSLPVDRLTTKTEGFLSSVGGDRRAEANISLGLAQLYAMQGQFDRARELYRRGQVLLRDLGPSVSAITTSVASARVEALAGELDAAEAELRRDEADLAQLGERYFRSSIAASLARILVLKGKLDEAERFAGVAAEIAEPDDVDPQIIWRSVRSRILAIQGDPETALRLSDEAIELTRNTEDVLLKAEALLDRSVVLTSLGRADEASAALEQALRLYEQKGDAVSAARIREALAVPAC